MALEVQPPRLTNNVLFTNLNFVCVMQMILVTPLVIFIRPQLFKGWIAQIILIALISAG